MIQIDCNIAEGLYLLFCYEISFKHLQGFTWAWSFLVLLTLDIILPVNIYYVFSNPFTKSITSDVIVSCFGIISIIALRSLKIVLKISDSYLLISILVCSVSIGRIIINVSQRWSMVQDSCQNNQFSDRIELTNTASESQNLRVVLQIWSEKFLF